MSTKGEEKPAAKQSHVSYVRIPYNSGKDLWHPPAYAYAHVDPCAAVIDIEALVMENFVLVEQIAVVIVDYIGRELYGNNFYIEQPLHMEELMQRYAVSRRSLRKAIEGYQKVTQDSYVHPKTHRTYTWKGACAMLHAVMQQYQPITIWAKGANLERRVFGAIYVIYELEDFGCPKYPKDVHDPLQECRFFCQYIPR